MAPCQATHCQRIVRRAASKIWVLMLTWTYTRMKRLCSDLGFHNTQRDGMTCSFSSCSGFCCLGSHPLQESVQGQTCENALLEATATAI